MNMKYYAIFYVNEKDPNDILGVCQGSFSFHRSRTNVCLWGIGKESCQYTSIHHKQFIRDRISKDGKTLRYGHNYFDVVPIKGQLTRFKKSFADPCHQLYHSCGRTNSEYQWKWVVHYSKTLPHLEGYFIKVCRVNSKHCPVVVDLSVRAGMDLKKIPYDKYRYRNAKFRLK